MSLIGRGHLGDDLAALVDGELGHAARDRALAHLAHCRACREEADAHRQLKARLVGLRAEDAGPAPDLLARLASLPRSGPAAPPSSPGPLPPPAPLPVALPARRSAVPRATVAAGALVAAGVAALLVTPGQTGPRPAVDPTSDVFVNQHASLSSSVPFTEPGAVVAPAGAAGRGR